MSEGEGGMSQGRFLLRLSLAFFGSFLAAGTLGSWSTFSSLLTGADVFADSSCMTLPPGKCSSQNERLQLLYYVTMGAQNIFSIPSGILFDQQGPRVTGMIGFVFCVISLAGVILALYIKQIEYALFLFVPLLSLAQNVASWGVFGFIFFRRNFVGLMTGICNSSFLLSSLIMYIIVALVNAGFQLRNAIFFLLLTSGLACGVSFFSIPTMKEYEHSFFCAFGQRIQARRSFKIILIQLGIVFKLRPFQTCFYFAASAGALISFSFWEGSVFQFDTFNIGEFDSKILASNSAIMYAVIGIVASPLTGLIFDKAGVLYYSVLFLALQCVATALIWPPNYIIQTVVSALMFFLYSKWLTFESKCPATFAPPDLYGSFLGVSNSISGMLQLVLNLAIPFAIGSNLAGKYLYLIPILALMVVGVFFLAVFVISLIVSPAPLMPPDLSKEKNGTGKNNSVVETEASVLVNADSAQEAS